MFTGIIAATGSVAEIDQQADGGRFRFATGTLDLSDVQLGDSIAVNGACLTVTQLHADGFSADLSGETLACTTLGERQPGDRVNFEKALAMGAALGGHMVTGHVDGVGTIVNVHREGDSLNMRVAAPSALARYIARKGSVCIDGTSLTVNAVDGAEFSVMIVPHTQTETIIAGYQAGSHVNLEVDIIARYLERLLQYTGPTNS